MPTCENASSRFKPSLSSILAEFRSPAALGEFHLAQPPPTKKMLMSTLRERSLSVFPAGSHGEFNLPDEMAIVVDRGEGCRLWDTDGREYLDFSMGWGSVLPGHACPAIVEAVTAQAPRGSNFAYVNRESLLLAEQLVEISPACDAVRFCASGTEATMYCQRLARAYTGRPKILKFEGAYHGANDVGVASLFPHIASPFPEAISSCDGVTSAATAEILVAPYNDLEQTWEIVRQHAEDLAGILVEPFHRCLSPLPGFLEGLRDLADEHHLVLMFDEVVTGFRLAFGGAQEYYGVVPDLVAYGKALGGGYPIGAFGGRQEIMDLVREDRLGRERYVWVASSLGGNPISTAAARAALARYAEPGTYEHLHGLGNYLRAGMRKSLEDHGVTGQVLGDGPLSQIAFTSQPVTDYRSGQTADKQKARRVMLELFQRGIFLNPMGTKLYLSLAHDEAVCDQFLETLAEVLADVS